MAHQPPFANEQTNQAANANGQPRPRARAILPSTASRWPMDFPPPTPTPGNYALDPHYQLPYVQVWNIDVQKTLPWGMVMNIGYNGSKGNHLDITSAPRATPSSPGHQSRRT